MPDARCIQPFDVPGGWQRLALGFSIPIDIAKRQPRSTASGRRPGHSLCQGRSSNPSRQGVSLIHESPASYGIRGGGAPTRFAVIASRAPTSYRRCGCQLQCTTCGGDDCSSMASSLAAAAMVADLLVHVATVTGLQDTHATY
ncbi:hypothetical protein E2562_026700 [Oryza meyeriana var. granulata]|uniref:Uncharacterized protein n=1 Tax=Oryza meyeriana var. granulata TaxID=110450 RepID=A0A6G1E160_9ORYZ|nr:hypothetical protein E2562_026700 [Oryza meyeriana var. granulata]